MSTVVFESSLAALPCSYALRTSKSRPLLPQLRRSSAVRLRARATCTSDLVESSGKLDEGPSLREKVESASGLNESVPSLLPNQEGGGSGGDNESGGKGGSGGGGEDSRKGHGEEGSDKPRKMSASQKLTLAYAALVGVGGAIGYLKGKSTKSLVSGGVSSLLLLYVATELPKNPVFAASVGLGVSAVLLTVMGARFKKSGKVFPAGVVAFVSLIMAGGYIHGIMRSSHA